MMLRVNRPIDAWSKAGRFQIIKRGQSDIAYARWDGERWIYPRGTIAVPFQPEFYVAP